MIFWNNLFKNLSFQQIPLRKPVEELSFSSDVAGLKSATLLKKMNHFTINPFCRHFRNAFVKEFLLKTKASLISISKVASNWGLLSFKG